MINKFDLYYSYIDKAILSNDNYSKLNNKKLLITGVNGMIASCIVDIIFILNNKYNYNIKVVGLMRDKSHLLKRFEKYDFLEIIEQDVINSIECEQEVDYIIHAASNANPNLYSKYPVDTMMSNFIGLKNILDYAKKSNSLRVLYISSGEVYGQADSKIDYFTENYLGKFIILNPRSCYPISKMASETLCSAYYSQFGVQSVVARPCHIYGPTQTNKDSRAASQFIRDGINGNNIIMKSEGRQVRSYCNVIDCATGIITILCKGENCNAYNVANNNSVLSIRKLAEKISSYTNTNLIFELPTDQEKNSYNPVDRSVLDGSKLENIGWHPIFDIDDGLKMTIDIMKR